MVLVDDAFSAPAISLYGIALHQDAGGRNVNQCRSDAPNCMVNLLCVMIL
jgi:hypothetical protein